MRDHRMRWMLAGFTLVAIAAVGIAVARPSANRRSDVRTADRYATGSSAPPASSTPGSVLEPRTLPAQPADTRFASPVKWMRVDRIGVDAPLVTVGIDRNGNMAAPDRPDVIGWYDFTGRPGLDTGNAVFAGHRDSRESGPAVFWRLDQLQPGDVIEVGLVDGSRLRYSVTATHAYPVERLDMREILATTEQPTLTLITCAGSFDRGDYEDRHIVRAVRVDRSAGG